MCVKIHRMCPKGVSVCVCVCVCVCGEAHTGCCPKGVSVCEDTQGVSKRSVCVCLFCVPIIQ